MVNDGSVSWTLHKQTTVALSSMGAEYMALSDASREAVKTSILPRTHTYSESLRQRNRNGTATHNCKAKRIDIIYHAMCHYFMRTRSNQSRFKYLSNWRNLHKALGLDFWNIFGWRNSVWSYGIVMYHARRLFSEYAASQRDRHNNCITRDIVKIFCLPQRIVIDPTLQFKHRECYEGVRHAWFHVVMR